MSKHQSKILSGAELIENRRSAGKNTSVNETKVISENSKIEAFYQKCNDVLREERVQKLGELSTAIYDDQDKTTELITHKGRFWLTMGYNIGKRKFLNAEEVVFLLEASQLEVRHNNIPISIEEAHAIYLDTQDCSLEEFQTFSHLTRLGYAVIRHRKPTNPENEEVTASKRGIGEDLEIEVAEKKRKQSSDDQSEAKGSLDGEASTSNHIRDFSDLAFPNCAAKWKFKLPVPSSDLLPPNVAITESMCSVNLFAIQNSVPSYSKKSNQRNNIYKKKKEDEEYPKLFNCNHTRSRCWSEFKDEMKNVTNYPMTPLSKLCYNVKLHAAVHSVPWGLTLPKISYDVYLPTETFTKNGSMLPNHRLIVTNVRNSVPNLNQLISLQTQFNDSIPIHYAVVSGGEVSFFALPCVDIPNLK